MPGRLFPGDQFSTKRRTAWARSRAQAAFRGEAWRLTFDDFCTFWSTEERWHQRGRDTDALVLSRFDYEKGWTKKNCCIITRYQHLCASRARRSGKDMNQFYEGALTYGQ
jgi:hypothetical protein